MYDAAKNGCIGFASSVAAQLKLDDPGIRIDCICPDTRKTGLLQDDVWDKFPQEGFTAMEEVAEATGAIIGDERGAQWNGVAPELIRGTRVAREPPALKDENVGERMSQAVLHK